MRIAAASADAGGCGWYRIKLPYSTIAGHEVAFITSDRDPHFVSADVLVVQRVGEQRALDAIKRAQDNGVLIVHDVDDLLTSLPSSNPCAGIYGTGKPATRVFEEAMRLADVMTASTSELAREYVRVRPNIDVCENMVKAEHLDALRPPEFSGAPKVEGQIRIGYAGSPTHACDIATIGKPLLKVAQKYPHVRFIFFGQPPPPQLRPVADRVQYVAAISASPNESAEAFMLRYYHTLRSLQIDIGVAPLESQTFNRCKSAIKLLEYGLVGIPVVASRVGPYRDYLGPAYMVLEDAEWITRLSALVESAQLRGATADANAQYIAGHHTSKTAIAPWQRVIDRLAAKALA